MKNYLYNTKGQLRATIFKSPETIYLILLCYFGDAIRCALSAEKILAITPLFGIKGSGDVRLKRELNELLNSFLLASLVPSVLQDLIVNARLRLLFSRM